MSHGEPPENAYAFRASDSRDAARGAPYHGPVLLEGPGGARLELSLVGYQFPEIEDDRWDANWLVVRIAAIDDPDSWTAEDPCLLTWEVDALADWLDAVAAASSPVARLEFVEPNLVFERIEENGAGVRVWFDLEFRPSGISEDEDLLIDFPVTPDALRAAAASLRAQRERFPVRGRGA